MVQKPKAAPKAEKLKLVDTDGIPGEAVENYAAWYEVERDNVRQSYEDLEFRAGKQWPETIEKERTLEERPILTVNGIPKFVRQVTGDMRQMKPSIKVVPVDSRGDPETAELEAGMIRYIENRSDAQAVYTSGADSQVVAGIGHWEVTTEYADDTTFNQELRIVGIADSIAVAWDFDARLPSREDAMWWVVPVDVSEASFKRRWPDAPMSDFDDITGDSAIGWFGNGTVRVAAYWKKVPSKRTLALMPDGTIDDLTDKEPEEVARVKAIEGTRVEKRDSYKVVRYLVTAAHVLEGPMEWPGRHIPIIPAVGEEFRIGKNVVRNGLVRFMKDPQRMMNYYYSAHAETVALQPKAPFVGTEKNFQQYPDEWSQANKKNLPYLPYTPDALNGGGPPQRVAPPVSSQGILDGLSLAAENMKSTIGIYDASLGNRSNETSGKAILARQREGDTGTFVYMDNFSRAIRRTGTILIDLIPHVYDTERMIRIVGEDGKVELKWINRPTGLQEQDPDTGDMMAMDKIENDVTVGAYDVVLETGPSYATKREEARDGMTEFIRSSPETAPVILDLVAKAQDWPLADEIAERFEAVAPPAVQKLIAEKRGKNDPNGQPGQPQQQNPQEQMAAMQMQLQQQAMQTQAQTQQAEAQAAVAKAAADTQSAQANAKAAMWKEQQAEVELEIARVKLQQMRQGVVQAHESHMFGTIADAQAHDEKIRQGSERHGAMIDKMTAPQPAPEAGISSQQ